MNFVVEELGGWEKNTFGLRGVTASASANVDFKAKLCKITVYQCHPLDKIQTSGKGEGSVIDIEELEYLICSDFCVRDIFLGGVLGCTRCVALRQVYAPQ